MSSTYSAEQVDIVKEIAGAIRSCLKDAQMIRRSVTDKAYQRGASDLSESLLDALDALEAAVTR